MRTGAKTVLYLVLLAVVDAVIPVPIAAGLLIYVVLARPPWFRDLVSRIYAS